MTPALFLDRDGVVNRALVRDGRPYAPTRLEDFEILPDAADTVNAVRGAGILVILVTNQPDLATGKQSWETIEEMHARLQETVPMDDILICPHVDDDKCDCRKPKPGLIKTAARKWSIDCASSVMVGDRWRDVEAGRASGCKTVFIDYGYDETQPKDADLIVASLGEAKSFILAALTDSD